MSPDDRERRLVSAIEDFHRRRGLGETPDPASYRERLGGDFAEFQGLVASMQALDQPKAPAAEAPLPRPFGPYVLERVLGGGGMGIVYQAFHRELVRRVAVKVLPKNLEVDPSMVERFRREARACAQVHHANVVTVFESGEIDGHLYYAMELVEGQTLQAHIEARTVGDPKVLCRALSDVADALDTLHRAGVVHRDVKPANLIVRPDGVVMLADFGLARTLYGAGLTQTGEALGTPPYMSPEQILGHVRDVDARTDVYGLGATLYHALSGAPPFAVREPQDLVRLVLVQRPESLVRAHPHVPAEVERVVMKALEKRKEDRYVTAGDLRDDLRRVAAGGRAKEGPVPAWKRGLRSSRRFVLPAAAAVALLLGGYLWWSHRPGTLRIDVFPPVTVVVDGTFRGETADGRSVLVDLAPGRHQIELRGRGYGTDPESIVIEPGQQLSYAVTPLGLKLVDLDSPEVLKEMARSLRVNWAAWTDLQRSRGGPLTDPFPFLPRGNVRPEDAAVLELLVPLTIDDERREIFVQRGGVDLVPPIPYPVLDDAQFGALPRASAQASDATRILRVPLPADAVAALRTGDTVTWGLRPARRRRDGSTHDDPKATFRVVDADASAALAGIDEGTAKQDPRVRALFRARFLGEKGLRTAAAREVVAVAAPADRTFHLWAVYYDALHGLTGLYDLDLLAQAEALLRARADRPEYRALFPNAPGAAPAAAPAMEAAPGSR